MVMKESVPLTLIIEGFTSHTPPPVSNTHQFFTVRHTLQLEFPILVKQTD